MAGLIYIVCEGQSESQFVKKVLYPWLLEKTGYRCQLVPYTVITSIFYGVGGRIVGIHIVTNRENIEAVWNLKHTLPG